MYKKHEEYIESDEQLMRKLLELGANNVILAYKKSKKTFKGRELSGILENLTSMEQIAHSFSRKGINFQEYLRNKNPDTGRFPKYQVTIKSNGALEHYFVYTDAELKKLRQDVEKRIGRQIEIFGEDANGESAAKSAFRWTEIYSATPLARLVANLEKKGFTIDQYETAETPLCYVAESDEKKTAIYSLPQLLDTVRDIARKNLNIQRYKGLGEMNPDQLYETTMNPENRKLLKVVLEDAVIANEIFSILMGNEVEPRRQFIEKNALNVRNLDV